jgi:hypothetical protein
VREAFRNPKKEKRVSLNTVVRNSRSQNLEPPKLLLALSVISSDTVYTSATFLGTCNFG